MSENADPDVVPVGSSSEAVAHPDQVRIFDTTLRDGEQAPGIALTKRREGRDRRAARPAAGRHPRGRLPDLLAGGVRGGPRDRRRRARPGDRGARADRDRRHRARGRGVEGRRALAHPHVHLDVGRAARVDAADEPPAGARRDRGERQPREGLHGRRRVQRAGRHTDRARLPAGVFPARGAVRRDDDQRARHRGLRHADRVRRAGPGRARGHARRRRDLDALPQRPRAGGRQRAGRHRERRPAGRGRGQRDRRAGGQLLPRGDRDDRADAPRAPRRAARPQHQGDHAHLAAGRA